MRILIVDNDKINREISNEQFSSEDEVIFCDNIYDARRMMCKEKFDLVASRYYWLEAGDSNKRARYIPAGVTIALDAYAVGVKAVVIYSNFMWGEGRNDEISIIMGGSNGAGSMLFEKAYLESMILTVDQCRGYRQDDVIAWSKCIEYAIRSRENYKHPENNMTYKWFLERCAGE